MKKNNIAIYTAIFGDYDNLIVPEKEISGCDFYCFTDNENLKSDFYKIIKIERQFSDPTRDARRVKSMSHYFLSEYKYTLWVDSNIHFRYFNVQKLFNLFLSNHDVAIHTHRVRDCVYKEAEECIKRSLDRPFLIVSQIVRYINSRYPVNNGLAETSVIFRRNTPVINKMNEDWWREISVGSKRDQLSIDYVAWKNNTEYFRINESVRNGRYFFAEKHKKDKDDVVKSAVSINVLKDRVVKLENIILNMKKSGTSSSGTRRLKREINIMKTSKFWKMRSCYLKIRGLITGEK